MLHLVRLRASECRYNQGRMRARMCVGDTARCSRWPFVALGRRDESRLRAKFHPDIGRVARFIGSRSTLLAGGSTPTGQTARRSRAKVVRRGAGGRLTDRGRIRALGRGSAQSRGPGRTGAELHAGSARPGRAPTALRDPDQASRPGRGRDR